MDEERSFAQIMELIMEMDGEAQIAEREKLEQDPAAVVPEDVSHRCLAFIHSFFSSEEIDSKHP